MGHTSKHLRTSCMVANQLVRNRCHFFLTFFLLTVLAIAQAPSTLAIGTDSSSPIGANKSGRHCEKVSRGRERQTERRSEDSWCVMWVYGLSLISHIRLLATHRGLQAMMLQEAVNGHSTEHTCTHTVWLYQDDVSLNYWPICNTNRVCPFAHRSLLVSSRASCLCTPLTTVQVPNALI